MKSNRLKRVATVTVLIVVALGYSFMEYALPAIVTSSQRSSLGRAQQIHLHVGEQHAKEGAELMEVAGYRFAASSTRIRSGDAPGFRDALTSWNSYGRYSRRQELGYTPSFLLRWGDDHQAIIAIGRTFSEGGYNSDEVAVFLSGHNKLEVSVRSDAESEFHKVSELIGRGRMLFSN